MYWTSCLYLCTLMFPAGLEIYSVQIVHNECIYTVMDQFSCSHCEYDWLCCSGLIPMINRGYYEFCRWTRFIACSVTLLDPQARFTRAIKLNVHYAYHNFGHRLLKWFITMNQFQHHRLQSLKQLDVTSYHNLNTHHWPGSTTCWALILKFTPIADARVSHGSCTFDASICSQGTGEHCYRETMVANDWK